MATLDTLDIKISANAMSAAKALDGLANSLKRVRSALMNTKDGVNVGDHLSKNIRDLNSAITQISNSGVRKLNNLSSALQQFSVAAKSIKGVSISKSAAKSIQNTQNALNAKLGTIKSSGGSARVNDTATNIKKIGDETEEAGEKAKKATGFFGKLWGSIKRIAFYRAIRSAMKAISEAFSEGLKNAYMYSKQSESFTRLAETLDHLKSVTSQMVNQLGAFWGEFKQFVQPAVTWLIEKVRQISEWLTELFAALNGEKTYLQAQYVAQEWEEATDAVNKYKHQLLGLDELNNLSANNGKKGNETDYSKLYKEVEVSAKLLAVGEKFQSLKQDIQDALSDTNLVLLGAVGTLAIGAILLFTTAHKLLGLGMMISSGLLIGETVNWDWETLRADIKQAFKSYRKLITKVAVGLAAIGMILLFIPTQKLRGISMIIASGVLMAANVAFNWTDLRADIKEAFKSYKKLITKVSVGLAAIGTILLFIPSQRLKGITMLIASGALMAANVTLNWNDLKTDVEAAFQKFGPLLAAVGLGSMVAGILLLFCGPQFLPQGLALLIGGGFLTAGTIAFNWDGILDGLKTAWNNIKVWWNNTVVNAVKKAVGWVEDQLHWDLNSDGTIGSNNISTVETSSSGNVHGGSSFKFGEGSDDTGTSGGSSSTGNVVFDMGYSVGKKVRDTLSKTWKGITDLFSWDAVGAIEKPGSLFFAGESGPEFVGAMGSSSAVANTGQMTDAIYKAAYMGMSKALQENGGNGLAGFVPATTDDLFIAMRKKASNYNKMTGSSAFA